ncbi:ATP-binding protein [Sulfitobacter sp. 915]|uniref:ATP-binding protein n=1 Tax=Sulfitobacter sp. 915 TaxID=3368558 RepID=UPI003746A694
MNFINQSMAEATAPLKSAHFPFPRGKELFDAMTWCTTDYYAKAKSGQPFEARGLLVIGESRQGKSREIQRLREKFNDGSVIMPDGRPATILHCILSGKVTWKDLGVKILGLLGYPLKGRRTQAEIWEKVIKYAELQGVVGIHFDECQHVFVERGDQTNQQILDSFKILLKESRWPLMLILSGIPSLAQHIAREEQLSFLLRTVRFESIDMGQQRDLDEMLQLTFTYAEKAGLDFGPLATQDFLERLAFACCKRWGLVIEMLIEAVTHGQQNGDQVCAIEHFEHAYAQIYSAPPGYSPFTMPDYRDGFDHARMMELLGRT